jgi:AraC-like DNA-binding protein
VISLSRSAILQGYQEVAEELGLDPILYLEKAGLPRTCLADADLKVSTDAINHLLELTANEANVADLGLRMADKRKFSTLGPIGLLMSAQPNVELALKVMVEHIWVHSENLSMDFEAAGDIVILAPAIAHVPGVCTRQASELLLAVIVRLMRRFLGQGWQPEMASFTHDRIASPTLYQRAFGRTPSFNQERTMLIVQSQDLAAKNPGADPAMAREIAQYLAYIEGERAIDLVAKVRASIRHLLPMGSCTAGAVAQALHMHRRTLHRRLASKGTSFEVLLNEVRLNLAADLLAAGNRSMTEVSQQLGFAHPSAFSRWRKRWLPKASPVAARS